ncbi:hypothetical protein [Desulfoscipio geothermicus]|uniref:Uncharacterized protein n=1 Tax=Desulfoscipio geothermicus DSM 3669 TaxID=1121426 RepID=A0A1I6DU11_9FIRM|nr:hypothetical protein [Desulfoscipio geothermicus]SFR08842.1 hypothetical protein SAMN05660706_11768 [Desulfoscipio geothermicus DSM 3669]
MTKELIDQILRDIGLEKIEPEHNDIKREAAPKAKKAKKNKE